MADHGQPRSYLEVDEGVDVITSDGQGVGKLEHVLADDQGDIFDGIVVDIGRPRRPPLRRRARGRGFRERAVILKLAAADAEQLPEPSDNPAVMQHGGEEDSESARPEAPPGLGPDLRALLSG